MEKKTKIVLALTLCVITAIALTMILYKPVPAILETVPSSNPGFSEEAASFQKYSKYQLSNLGLITVEEDASTSYLIPLQTSSESSETQLIKINSSSIPCWSDVSVSANESENSPEKYILLFTEDEDYVYFYIMPESAVTNYDLLGTKLG